MIDNKEKYKDNDVVYKLLLDLEMAISFKRELEVAVIVFKLKELGFTLAVSAEVKSEPLPCNETRCPVIEL